MFTLICSLYSSCFYCFICFFFSSSFNYCIFLFSLDQNLPSFPFPSLRSYLYLSLCVQLYYVIHKYWHSNIFLTISIFYFFSNAVNCGYFRTTHDESKYWSLFYHFFDLNPFPADLSKINNEKDNPNRFILFLI